MLDTTVYYQGDNIAFNYTMMYWLKFKFASSISSPMFSFFRDRIISMQFMRKYIHVAKDIRPVLTREAADYIAEEYSKLRNHDNLQQDHIARVRDWNIIIIEYMVYAK